MDTTNTNKVRYFEFPIQLIQGFMDNKTKCMQDILCYSLYNHSLKLRGYELDAMRDTLKFFNLSYTDPGNIYKRGQLISDSISNNSSTSINTKIFFDYYENDKTEFQMICLLAYLALRSKNRNKAYAKWTNDFWFSRMAGFSHTTAKEDLPPIIAKYFTEHYSVKIKNELKLNWYLVTYGKAKGFWVSFDLPLDKLIYHVEKKKIKYKLKQLKEKERDAHRLAMEKLAKESFS